MEMRMNFRMQSKLLFETKRGIILFWSILILLFKILFKGFFIGNQNLMIIRDKGDTELAILC